MTRTATAPGLSRDFCPKSGSNVVLPSVFPCDVACRHVSHPRLLYGVGQEARAGARVTTGADR